MDDDLLAGLPADLRADPEAVAAWLFTSDEEMMDRVSAHADVRRGWMLGSCWVDGRKFDYYCSLCGEYVLPHAEQPDRVNNPLIYEHFRRTHFVDALRARARPRSDGRPNVRRRQPGDAPGEQVPVPRRRGV